MSHEGTNQKAAMFQKKHLAWSSVGCGCVLTEDDPMAYAQGELDQALGAWRAGGNLFSVVNKQGPRSKLANETRSI